MFLLALSFFIFGRLSAGTCIEERLIGLLDCRGLSLKTVGRFFARRQLWVITIDLSENNFVVINTTELLDVFPNLQLVDLRQNVNLDCWAIQNSKVPVTSDCVLPPLSLTTSTFDVLTATSRKLLPSRSITLSMATLWLHATSDIVTSRTTCFFSKQGSLVFSMFSTLVTIEPTISRSVFAARVKTILMVRQRNSSTSPLKLRFLTTWSFSEHGV